MLFFKADIVARASAALASTTDPATRAGIILLRDSLIGGQKYLIDEQEITTSAQGIISFSSDPQVRFGVAGLAWMLGAAVTPTPVVQVESGQERLPYVEAVLIDAPGREV